MILWELNACVPLGPNARVLPKMKGWVQAQLTGHPYRSAPPISSLPERVLMRIERKLDPELHLRNRGTQTVLPHCGLTRRIRKMSPIVRLGLSD